MKVKAWGDVILTEDNKKLAECVSPAAAMDLVHRWNVHEELVDTLLTIAVMAGDGSVIAANAHAAIHKVEDRP